MPQLGEIRKGQDIGKDYAKYIWHACIDCGKERWVKWRQNKPQALLCLSCANHRRKWKGGKRRTTEGYIQVWLSKHDFFFPMTQKSQLRYPGGYVTEHRLIMAKHLGRCLHSWEIVHHRNGIKDDNRLENLQLFDDIRHKQITFMKAEIHQLQKRVTLLEAENAMLNQRLMELEECQKSMFRHLG